MLQCIIIEKCKAKAIQADLTIFTHIPAYSGMFTLIQTQSNIFRNYSSIFRTLCNLVYFESYHVQNQKHIQNRVIFRTPKYSAPCQTSTIECFAKIVNNYNDFPNISFSLSLLCEKNMYFLNTCLIFTPGVVIRCKKVWGPREPGTVHFWYTYLLKYSNN